MAKLISKTYGDALFELAVEKKCEDSLLSETEEVLEALSQNPDFSKLMTHPKILKEEKLKIAKERLGLLKTVDGAKNKKSQSLKKEETQFPEENEEETAAEAAKEEPAPEKEKEEPPKAESLWTRENLTLEELEEKLWQEAEAEMEGNAEGDYGEEEDGKASREEETADAEQQMSDELET